LGERHQITRRRNTPSCVIRAALQVRHAEVDLLQIDLARPGNDHFVARELLQPSSLGWQLSGFLLLTDVPIEQRSDPNSDADVGSVGGEHEDGDDKTTREKAPRRTGLCSPSMGFKRAGARWQR
jgi:hypothetical protein